MCARKVFPAEAIAMAACSLLGSPAVVAGDGNTQVGLSALKWSEAGRVAAFEPVLDIQQDLGNDRSVNVKLVLDTLSGASHNGAAPQPYAQTFSAASGGGGGYSVPANEVPKDPGFEDQRTAVSLGYQTPLANPLWKTGLGASYSRETDFLSLSASGTLTRDFNRRNTSVVGGLSIESDTITPTGGAPIPFALRTTGAGGEIERSARPREAGESGEEEGGGGAPAGTASESRHVVDAMVGVTQVINRTTLTQFSVGYSVAQGYMNDPYKIVTIDTAPATYVYESRPDSRKKLSLYWEGKHAFASGNIVDAGYRWMKDDWGVVSHTVDVFYRIALPAHFYVEPHARWYRQTAADFFVHSLAPADVFPAGSPGHFVSGDYRLGAITDTTRGVRVGWNPAEGSEIYLRSEKFAQTGDWAPADMNATIVEFGGNWRF